MFHPVSSDKLGSFAIISNALKTPNITSDCSRKVPFRPGSPSMKIRLNPMRIALRTKAHETRATSITNETVTGPLCIDSR